MTTQNNVNNEESIMTTQNNVNNEESIMENLNENNTSINANVAMSAEEVQEWVYTIGEAEEESAFLAKDFVNYLEERGITDEKALKEWAVKQLLWESDWPGPRSIWQQITKGVTSHEGKKARWKVVWEKDGEGVPRRLFKIEWGKEFALWQTFSLSCVAGLGRIAGVIASRKKRSSSSTVPGSNTSTAVSSGNTSTAVSNSNSSEASKLKEENTRLYKEIEDLRSVQSSIYDRAKEEFSAAIIAAENRERLAGKAADAAKKQAESMDKAIIDALSILNKASIGQDSSALFALIEEAKTALANAPKVTLGA